MGPRRAKKTAASPTMTRWSRFLEEESEKRVKSVLESRQVYNFQPTT